MGIKYLKGLMVVIMVVAVTGCFNKKTEDLEAKFKTVVTDYYENQVKGNIGALPHYAVTINDLEFAQVDIKPFLDAKCDKDSYIILNFKKDDNGVILPEYDLDVHLTCEK